MDFKSPSHQITSNATTDNVDIVREYEPQALYESIDWSYFFFAWGVSPHHSQAGILRKEAETTLLRLQDEGVLARAAGSWRRAWSEDDDIFLPANGQHPATRLCFLRQQHARTDAPCLCLSDFIAPADAVSAPISARFLGLFATAVSSPADALRHPPGCPCCNPLPTAVRPQHLWQERSATLIAKSATTDKRAAVKADERSAAIIGKPVATDDNDVYTTLLRQTLLDRLAEAAASLLHAEMLKHFGTEPVNTEVRPAVGYPSMPDQSLIFDIAPCLPFGSLGITLTSNGMMLPHAATCGLVFAHPAARYFDVGHVNDDQLEDYARRRNTTADALQRFMTRRLR